MIDTKRHWFKGLEHKTGGLFNVLPISPNQYTYLSGVFAVIGLYFMVSGNLKWAVLFYVIAAALDFVDGAVARTRKTATKIGAYLDTILDRYVEGLIFFGMLFMNLPVIFIPGYAWIFLALFGSIVTTYSKAAAKEKDLVNQELKGGWLSRGERLFLIFLALIGGMIYPDLVFTTYILIFIAVFANITAIQRIYSAIRINN